LTAIFVGEGDGFGDADGLGVADGELSPRPDPGGIASSTSTGDGLLML
jgi:hypothetical protein